MTGTQLWLGTSQLRPSSPLRSRLRSSSKLDQFLLEILAPGSTAAAAGRQGAVVLLEDAKDNERHTGARV